MPLQDFPATDLARAEPAVAVQLTRLRRLGMTVKAIELRIRFIALMAATALVFASWDTVANHVEKWCRPRTSRDVSSPSSPEVEWFCPMHPSVVRQQADQCPSCGMSLTRRIRSETATLDPGVLSRVWLAPGQIAQAGIRTVPVSFAPATARLMTIGVVEFDDSRHVEVASEARGRSRIERLHIHSAGERVRAGQRLAELYSYDIAQSIRALLEASSALRAPSAIKPDPETTPLGDPGERFQLATQALQVLGVRQDQIDAIALDRRPDGLLPLIAPIGGLVIKKVAYQGQYVPEGTPLFEIADLSHVWVNAQVFENQLALVRVGQPVTATVPAFPGEVFRGQVEQLAPALDPTTRTLAIRFGLDNPGDRLRPGMFVKVGLDVACRATTLASGSTCPVTHIPLGKMGPAISVEIQGHRVSVCCEACVPKLKAAPSEYVDAGPLDDSGPGRVLSVPESAVIDTGTKTIVYVEASPGVFEGRAVVLGPRSGDSFPILEGLAPGDRVAAAGAFLIDAETRINPRSEPAGRSASAEDPR